MLIAAGLLARKARQHGLAPGLGEDLARPGSPAAASYLKRSGLPRRPGSARLRHRRLRLHHLHRQLRPLVPEEMAKAIQERGVVAAAVLSGNRNFPGRSTRSSTTPFFASPPLVVAFGLAGSVDLDISREPVGRGHGEPVFLKDLWPGEEEIAAAHAKALDADDFVKAYADVRGGPAWAALEAPARVSLGILARPTSGARRSWRSQAGERRRGVRGPAAHRLGRRHHDRPHLARRGDPAQGRGWRLPGRRRRGPERPQRLLVPPRQLRGHGAGPVHQPLGPQPPGASPAGLDHPCPLGRAPAVVPGGRALPRRGGADGDSPGRHYGSGSSRDWAAKGPASWACAPCWPAASSGSTAPT